MPAWDEQKEDEEGRVVGGEASLCSEEALVTQRVGRGGDVADGVAPVLVRRLYSTYSVHNHIRSTYVVWSTWLG